MSFLQSDDSNSQNSDSEAEEPSPEALARYLAMRRHTVGVGEVPEDARVKLANHQPIIAMPQPNLLMPYSFLPHINLPQTLPYVQNDAMQSYPVGEQQHLLQPPSFFGTGMFCHLNYITIFCLCHDIAEILLKLALNTNQSISHLLSAIYRLVRKDIDVNEHVKLSSSTHRHKFS